MRKCPSVNFEDQINIFSVRFETQRTRESAPTFLRAFSRSPPTRRGPPTPGSRASGDGRPTSNRLAADAARMRVVGRPDEGAAAGRPGVPSKEDRRAQAQARGELLPPWNGSRRKATAPIEKRRMRYFARWVSFKCADKFVQDFAHVTPAHGTTRRPPR